MEKWLVQLLRKYSSVRIELVCAMLCSRQERRKGTYPNIGIPLDLVSFSLFLKVVCLDSRDAISSLPALFL